MAEVPLDYGRPRGFTTRIALARIPATDTANRIGSVFINPGGPGGSGVDWVLTGFGDYLSGLLHGRFDVVGFDPRGVAASDPIRCFESNGAEDAYLAGSPIFAWKHDLERPYFDLYSMFGELCVEHASPIRAHMSTADVARDLDLLRRAVGDERLTYLGVSYGTFIGNTYANLFPDRVRALVVDGVVDPRLWSSGWQILSDMRATQPVVGEFLRLCDEAGEELCRLSGPGGAAARYDGLLQELRAAPFVSPDGWAYSYEYFVADAVGCMYSPEVWPTYAAFLAEIADALLGDPGAAVRARVARAEIHERLRAPRRDAYDNARDAYWGNACADIEYPRSFRPWRAVDRLAEQASIHGPFWWAIDGTACARWPVAADRYVGPWSTTTAAPVLVVGNYFDTGTDYAGAVASSKLLRNSRLLSYAGWGHTAFGRSDCVTEYVARYLVDGTLPPKGTVCPANPNPFLPEPQGRRARGDKRARPLLGLPPPWLLR